MWLAPTGHPVAVIFLSMEHPAVRTDGGGGSRVRSVGISWHPHPPQVRSMSDKTLGVLFPLSLAM